MTFKDAMEHVLGAGGQKRKKSLDDKGVVDSGSKISPRQHNKRRRSAGFFDLGSFVDKVKARDITIAEDLAWFSERAQTFQETKVSIDVVREYLQMCDCDLEHLVSYLDIYSEDRESLLQVILALDYIFMRFQEQEDETPTVASLRSKVIIQAQRVLSQQGSQLASLLTHDGDPVVMKPVLKLFTSMVLAGPEVADVFVQSIDLSFLNGCFTRVRIRETISIRTCAQYLLIALLVISKRTTLWRLLEQQSIFPWAFAGLVHDRPTDVIGFLETILERVVNNSSLSKSLKINILNKTTLTPVLSLLIWKGQLEWRGKEWSRIFLYTKKAKDANTAELIRGNELIVATPAEQKNVRACAAKVLSAIFFNSKQGISFRDPRLGLGERNCNFIVTQVVSSCPQVFSEPQGADFMADLLTALPDQIKYIVVDRYFNFRAPRLSRTYCNFYRALSKIVTQLDFSQLVAKLEPTSADQYIDLVNHFCLFLFVPNNFADYKLTPIYAVLTFINAMLKKLIEFMASISREKRRVLIPFIKDHIMQPCMFASLLKCEFDAKQIADLTEYTGADVADFTLSLLETTDLLTSPILGYISANIGWGLLADVDAFIKGKVSPVKKLKIYLRLIGMVLSFQPNFENELVKTDMEPMRLLFGLLAEASTTSSFQVELLSHAINVLEKFPRFAKYGAELELWVSTVLSSDQPDLNHAYSMALCDALRDSIIKGGVLENEIHEMVFDGQQGILDPSRCFSPISANIVSLDHDKYPVFTAVMREILHRQANYAAYITFLQKHGKNRLDTHFTHYMNFLLKGEKPFVNTGSLNVNKFSSELAMQLESAFVASMTGGHPKSLERMLVKIKFSDKDAVNVSLLNQLIFIVRWCQDHDQTLFINPVATCLRYLTEACDPLTLSRLADFISSDVIQKRFCVRSDLEVTLMVLVVIKRVLQAKVDVGFDLISFKDRSLAAVLNGILDVVPFIEAFGDMSTGEDVASLIEFICNTGKAAKQSLYSVISLLPHKGCKLSTESTKQLVELAHQDAEMRSPIEAFFKRNLMHASAIEMTSLYRLIEVEEPISLTILMANPCFVRAIGKKLRSVGDLKGSDCVYSLELLRIIAHEDHENPSKETSGFIYRSLLASLKKYLQKGELQNEATVVALVQALLDHLQHAVFIFSKDYVKLLKTVLPFVDKVSVLLLVVINAVLEFGDFSEDALIAALKCLTKLTTRLDTPTETYMSRSCVVLEKQSESAWKSVWLRENFEQVLKSLLKRGFTSAGTPLRVLRILCSKVFVFASPAVTALQATEMVFGHSKFLPTLTGKDSLLKQELVQLLITLVEVDGPNVCKTPHIPILLSGYDASLSLSDQRLYHLLSLYEKNRANLARFQPLIWGEAAPSFYSVDKGTSGVSVLKNATINQVLAQISQQRLLASVGCIPQASLALDPAVIVQVDQGAEIYDPRFVQTSILHILDELSEVQTIRLIEEKIQLLSIATLSAKCDQLRALGYTFLSRIYKKMERVSSHPVVLYMMAILDLLRNSLGTEGVRRLNSLTVGYLIRCCEVVISDPNHPLYNQLIRNSLARPAFNIHRLPSLFGHYISSSMASRERRIWIEAVLTDFVQDSRDMELLYSQGLFDNIIMFSQSRLCSEDELVIILRMFKKWIANGRFRRYNLIAFWLTQLLQCADSRSPVVSAVLDVISTLTQRLATHSIREKEMLLPNELIHLHIQLLQCISDVSSWRLRTFATSLSQALALPGLGTATCIAEHTAFTLLEMLKEVRSKAESENIDDEETANVNCSEEQRCRHVDALL
ncbi:uncharacterized protein LOC111246550 isoform X2 [Varroa destructor]|uniref:Nucleolar pre-ribosomal-associated protein 1 n=1 Tax=Varroa destructor TaxID=109461 RepID=A0A7M7JH34_VARDE|nr:uncharacterized protein LOC111246550 isoform X2 [Varroa destructor]